MRTLESIESLNIPQRHKDYLQKYLNNISDIPYISQVYLFGSCASETVSRFSDIDLFITTSREVTDDEEAEIAMRRLPEYSMDTVPTDIIIQTDELYAKFTGVRGMVQNQIAKKGLNLNGLLRKRG